MVSFDSAFLLFTLREAKTHVLKGAPTPGYVLSPNTKAYVLIT
jgi:hypothetical protein